MASPAAVACSAWPFRQKRWLPPQPVTHEKVMSGVLWHGVYSARDTETEENDRERENQKDEERGRHRQRGRCTGRHALVRDNGVALASSRAGTDAYCAPVRPAQLTIVPAESNLPSSVCTLGGPKSFHSLTSCNFSQTMCSSAGCLVPCSKLSTYCLYLPNTVALHTGTKRFSSFGSPSSSKSFLDSHLIKNDIYMYTCTHRYMHKGVIIYELLSLNRALIYREP